MNSCKIFRQPQIWAAKFLLWAAALIVEISSKKFFSPKYEFLLPNKKQFRCPFYK
jgi:hypothetical protein